MAENYTIIADSCCDLKSKDLAGPSIKFITTPILYTLGGIEYADHEETDITDLLAKMKQSKTAPKSSCPAPETFTEQMRTAEGNIICITLSSKLSGTFASASLAAETVRAEQPDKKIFILDSLSASAGQARLLYKLVGLIESKRYTFEEITERITVIRNNSKIRFLLNDLGNLVKSGRMSKIAGIITSLIPIKLICGDNGEGEIKKYKQVVGFTKGVNVLSEFPGEHAEDPNNLVVISHCNNEESANVIKRILEAKFGFKNIRTLLMRGIAAFLANDKGLAIAY